MLKKSFKADPLINFFLNKSSLTNVQIDSILCGIEGQKRGIPEREWVKLRDGKEIKLGALMRSLEQGKSNLISSLYTILFAQYIGILPNEVMPILIEGAQLISQISGKKLTKKEQEQITSRLDDIFSSLFPHL